MGIGYNSFGDEGACYLCEALVAAAAEGQQLDLLGLRSFPESTIVLFARHELAI